MLNTAKNLAIATMPQSMSSRREGTTNVKVLVILGIPVSMLFRRRGLTASLFNLGLANRLDLAQDAFLELDIWFPYLLDGPSGMLVSKITSSDVLTLYQAGPSRVRWL